MNYSKDAIIKNNNTKELSNCIIECIQEKKGEELVKLDLRKLDEAPTDLFIVCHGESTTQVKAISDHILTEVKKKIGSKPKHIEGQQNATWILIDYFDVVVHIFNTEAREFYQLESLWSDAEVTTFTEN